jgi:hypothetical protein
MASKQPWQHYCHCGTRLAKDNSGHQCARCERLSRDKLIAPPGVPPEFWQTEQFRQAFAAQHMGWVARAYRTHPYHHAVYGPDGISQALLGQWVGMRQPHVSRFENGPPTQHLDTLRHWVRVLQILAPASDGQLALPAGRSTGAEPASQPEYDPADDPARDPILVAPWDHRGTVKAVVVLSGGVRVKRRVFISLTGPALTAPAHQWLVHEPGPLISGLSGGRISGRLVTQISAVVAELRQMDDVGGGGSVLAMAEQLFAKVAGLLDRASYDEATGRALHVVLAELGQMCGWSAYDSGEHGLAQRYWIAGLRAAHTADDRPLGAYILGCLAEQEARQGRPADALTLIETALAGSRGWQTPRLLAQLYNWQSWACAALQDSSACTAAISRARAQTEQFQADHDPTWLYWVNSADVIAGSGQCLLLLDKPDRAAAMLDEGITLFDESLVRDRQIHLTYLIDALARPGQQRDLERAACYGIQSLDLAEGLDSMLSITRIRGLSQQLKPHAEVAAVQEFLGRVERFGRGGSDQGQCVGSA